MGGTVETILRNTLVLNTKSKLFLSPKILPDIFEVTGGSLRITLTVKIILLQ